MIDKLKLFFLKWVYSAEFPPTERIYYDGYYIYANEESMHKFKLKNDLYPKTIAGIAGKTTVAPKEGKMEDFCKECAKRKLGIELPYNSFSAEEARLNTEKVVEEIYNDYLKMVPEIVEETFKRIKESIRKGKFYIRMDNSITIKNSNGDEKKIMLTDKTFLVYKEIMNKLGYKIGDFHNSYVSLDGYYYVEWEKESEKGNTGGLA